MNNRELPKVSVVTITYGHEKYITETLDGVLMQQYDGPVEFIIANDNSPDATDEVVKKYFLENPAPSNFEIKYTKHETNKGMSPNFIWALEQATGKYIALCEGDDYWTDPLKLQKQVSFLENNTDTSMVYTDSFYYYQNKGELVKKRTQQLKGFDDLLIRNQIWTLTICIRRSIVDEYTTKYSNGFKHLPFGDYPLWLFAATKGKLKHLKDITSVYRVLEESASHSKDPQKLFKIAESVYQCKIKFMEKFKQGDYILYENRIKGVKAFTQLNIALKYNNKEIYKLIINDLKYIKYYDKKYYYFFSLTKINFFFFSVIYKYILSIRKKISILS